jgi:DNA-binding NarL/FixJ family response regulator
MPISLVLADDHPLILDGLENLFRLEKDFQVLSRCTNGSETMQAVHRHRPDVLVLDIRMPGKDGLEIAREMRKEKLPTRVVFLTAELDEKELLEAIRLGVQGIVLTEMALKLLVQCIRKVHAGEQWIERLSARQALEKMLRREAGAREIAAVLTPREIAIVCLVAGGLRNKEIADKLCISEGTVKIHMHNIYEKLHLDGRVALLRYAQEKGLVRNNRTPYIFIPVPPYNHLFSTLNPFLYPKL